MNRRTFVKKSFNATAVFAVAPLLSAVNSQNPNVRLGGPLFDDINGPDAWVAALKKQGYRAAYCPVKPDASIDIINAYALAAKKGDIVIAEVGAWSNPLSADPSMAQQAVKKCVESLALAEAIGANCCVNISGSKNPQHWAGPHKENFSETTFEQIVDVTRKIIAEVKPTRTYFTLEFMPWIHPDSADSYLRIIKAVNHKQFAVHMDPVNIINSPRAYYSNGLLIKECFAKLGPRIRSCHGKDITLKEDSYSTQLEECRPGLGQLDYRIYLKELSKLKDIPLMLEHLPSAAEYEKAASYVRSVGKDIGVAL
jgi:sugar phosphate isomerase/epimerase